YIADYIIGDMDSVKNPPKDSKILVFPTDKNFTDGELAIKKACEMGAAYIAIYGATGGRPDHVLGNYSLLKQASDMGADAVICADGYDVFYKNTTFEIKTEPNDIISLVSFGSDCLVRSSQGVKYDLTNLLLSKSNGGRGISNIATDNNAKFELAYGDLLVFHFFQK
ncbi:thiamine diphosphokinase, partial [bacterium]|nr:thiamine diphosphokinase [bacterium]